MPDERAGGAQGSFRGQGSQIARQNCTGEDGISELVMLIVPVGGVLVLMGVHAALAKFVEASTTTTRLLVPVIVNPN